MDWRTVPWKGIILWLQTIAEHLPSCNSCSVLHISNIRTARRFSFSGISFRDIRAFMHLGKPAEVLAFSAIHRYAYLQTIPERRVHIHTHTYIHTYIHTYFYICSYTIINLFTSIPYYTFQNCVIFKINVTWRLTMRLSFILKSTRAGQSYPGPYIPTIKCLIKDPGRLYISEHLPSQVSLN